MAIVSDTSSTKPKRCIALVVLDWLMILPFMLCFISTLLVFDILQRIALPLGQKFHAVTIYGLNHCLTLCLRVLGTRISFAQAPQMQLDKPYIVISNHQSMFDIPLLYCAFSKHRPRFISKQELARGLPSVSFNLRHGHNALIDRNDARGSIRVIEQFAKLITDHNYLAVIFPEGTRAKTGVLGSFRTAGATALLKHAPTADVIPAAIDGSWKLNKHWPSPAYSFSKIDIKIGPILSRNETTSNKEIAEQAFQFITSQVSPDHEEELQ